MKPIALFGAGKIGKRALSLIGRECVAYFVDNFITDGELRDGIEVISANKFLSIAKQYTTIITIGENDADHVAEQLRHGGIKEFLFLDEVVNMLHLENRKSIVRDDVTDELLMELHQIVATIKRHYNFKQDATSEVEFYLVDSFEISHFLPLYHELMWRGIRTRFVAEPCCINTVGNLFDTENANCILTKLDIEFMTLSNPTANVAITTQYAYSLKRYLNFKCQMFYGVNFLRRKIFQHEKSVAKEFNLIFTHGEFNSKELEKIIGPGHTVDMSFPRYLEFVQSKPQKEKLLHDLGICTRKPILLYYPTWDEYSSISDYAKMIRSLHDEFYTVVKPHHCTYRLPEKADDMKQLNENFDCVLTGTFELWKTTAIADIAICDAGSGVLSEIVFLNPGLKLMTIYKNNGADDFYIDLSKLAVPVDHPEKFLSLFHQLWKADLSMKARREFIDKIYSPDVAAGLHRAADAVQSMLKRQTGGGRK